MFRFSSTANTEIEKKAHRKITELMKIAQEKGLSLPHEEGNSFSMRFDLNSVSMAGQACSRPMQKEMFIRIHKKGLEEYGDIFINQTVVHEFAHIIQFVNFPRATAHGREFKRIMRMFGAEERRCHNYDLRSLVGGSRKTRKPQKKYSYICNCSEYDLSSIRHKRIQQGTVYSCVKCKSNLVLV